MGIWRTIYLQLYLSALLVFVVFSVFAKSPQAYLVHQLGLEQGLLHSNVTTEVQDTLGFIWLGTPSGLQRFDGTRLHTFQNPLAADIYSNRIVQLFSKGWYVWVATENGLFAFDIRTEKFVRSYFPEPISQLVSIMSDSFSRIWFCTTNHVYVVPFTQDGYQKMQPVESLLDGQRQMLTMPQVRCLFQIENYMVLCSLGWAHSYQFNANGSLQKPKVHRLSDNFYNRRVEVRNDTVFLLANRGVEVLRLAPYNESNFTLLKRVRIDEYLSDIGASLALVYDLAIDKQQNIWLASDLGLHCIDSYFGVKPHITTYTTSDGLSSNSFYSVYIDRTNCLWAGTYGGGVNYFSMVPKPFQVLDPASYLPRLTERSAFVTSIKMDNQQRLWISFSKSGVIVVSPQGKLIRHLTQGTASLSDIPSPIIKHMAYDSINHKMLLSLTSLLLIDTENFTISDLSSTINSPSSVMVSSVDAYGQYWIGTFASGVFVLQRKGTGYEVRNYPLKGETARQPVCKNFFFDACKNEMLLGTGEGIVRFALNSKGEVTSIYSYRADKDYPNELSSNFINNFQKKNDSVYWVSTIGGGINQVQLFDEQLDNGLYACTSRSITQKEGLPSNDVESFLMDDNGNLWIASIGLSQYNPESGEIWNFGRYDGIQGLRFNQRAAYKDNQGNMYFGGANGITIFHPDKIARDTNIGASYIIGIAISGKEMGPGDTINGRVLIDQSISLLDRLSLKFNENDIRFELATIEYSNQGKISYRYMLQGVDKDWKYNTYKPAYCSYTDLQPGDYVFRVYSSNADGLWSTTPIHLAISIAPPWYRSALAKVMYTVLLGTILVLVFLYQRKYYRVTAELEIKKLNEVHQEELLQEKLRFFTNISHELRTPLSLILSPMDDLLRMEHNPAMLKLIRMVHRNSQRLKYLVEQLIKFRKSELGIDKIELEKTELNAFVAGIAVAFEQLARKKGVDFAFTRASAPINTFIDRGKVSTIIYNLLSNALKYTPAEGLVSVEVIENSELFKHRQPEANYTIASETKSGHYVAIRVVDSGKGIPPHELENIFERFYQATNTTKIGFGIGLALVKNLVLQHKGRITVWSTIDKGTDYLVELSMDDSVYAKHDFKTGTSEDLVSEKIGSELSQEGDLHTEDNFELPSSKGIKQASTVLLVEDNLELRAYLTQNLRKNYNVVEADNGKEGLSLALEIKPSIIITDVMMPVMDGIQLTRELRNSLDTSHIPIVILSAKSDIQDIIEGTQTGADDYLPKPFNIDLLRAKIGTILKNRQRVIQKYSENALSTAFELASSQKDKEFVDELTKLVEGRLNQKKISIDHLSRQMGINRTTFYSKVKELTGETPNDFIKGIRIRYAVSYMVSEQKSIADAAYLIGMSPSYFSSSFKEMFQITPSEFIKKLSSETEN